jgi:outer membrane protein OmpA-like peptidoglycan-associated protein
MQLLKRDSLDFNNKSLNVNSSSNEFNPIPYKGGILFVSNKKTNTNPLGFNKVYWVASNELGSYKGDSLILTNKIKLTDDFTAPTSNDNDILTRYTKKRKNIGLNSVESIFANFNPDQSFTIIDSSNKIIYPKLSSKKINGKYFWEIWQSNVENGKLKNNQRINIIDSAADYLYPSISKDGNRLYFSSNRLNGQGGLDIYYIENMNGQWLNEPKTLKGINTNKDEIYPNASTDTLYFASNRDGGIGGFDLYKNINGFSVNLGYPINSSSDDIAYSNIANTSFVSSTRAGNIDIVSLEYKPINIVINGNLNYANDATILANQIVYIYDQDENKIIDSVMSDNIGKFNFTTKPNRGLLLKIKNAEGRIEVIALKTTDKINSNYNLLASLKGKSSKQIADSLFVLLENKRKDSLASYSLGNKYVIYYDFDKSIIRQKEQNILDSLLYKLDKIPSANIVIGAFTDCVGSYKYNYKLSVKRAQSVVKYLLSKGLEKNRIISNGYSKQYSITPCLVKTNRATQQINRRAEIVLSEQKNTTWAELERLRGINYYIVYSNYPKKNNKVKVINTIKNETLEAKLPVIVKKDTVIAKKLVYHKKDSTAKIIVPTKKDTVVKVIIPVKKDTVVKVIVPVKKDTILAKKPVLVKKDTLFVNKPIIVKKDSVIVAKASEIIDELSKEEILKALDSLATLRKEQERIVEYMTKRINKKPIDVFVSSDSVTIEIYDNAIHDKDSVSIIYNSRIIVDKQELKVNKPIRFKLLVDKNKKYNELVMVAENLGAEPPNTAVMFVTEKSGRRQQVLLSTDMTHNEVVYFIRIGKE